MRHPVNVSGCYLTLGLQRLKCVFSSKERAIEMQHIDNELTTLLGTKGLRFFAQGVEALLHNFKGLEEWVLGTENKPRQVILRALGDVQGSENLNAETLAEALIKTGIFNYHAYLNGEPWKLLEEPFTEFDRRAQGYPVVCEDFKPAVSIEELSSFLIGAGTVH